LENEIWRMKPSSEGLFSAPVSICFAYFSAMIKWYLLYVISFVALIVDAQAPPFIPHQGIARNGNGEPLMNINLTARFSIRSSTPDGLVVWQEQQQLQTNSFGLFTAQLGSVVSLSAVDWNLGKRYLQVELNVGSGFIDVGTEQLLSVPYALHTGQVRVQSTLNGDTVFIGNSSIVMPGTSAVNHGTITTGTTLHSCGAPDVHNPELKYGSMVDQEGNSYKTIIIGQFEIMAENLNTSTYRNGDPINTGLANNQWQWTNGGAWTYYNNDSSYECPYGKWYNWFAASNPVGICPLGWHVPNEEEWNLMLSTLDPITPAGEVGNVSGGPMKSVGTTYWDSPNDYATNSSGFSGLPNGNRNYTGVYYSIGQNSNWWSADQFDSQRAWYISMSTTGISNGHYHSDKNTGFPVRCFRD
jgi:uncharacterized protein (TIGR02145 family)